MTITLKVYIIFFPDLEVSFLWPDICLVVIGEKSYQKKGFVMHSKSGSSSKTAFLVIVGIMVLMVCQQSSAITHIITFGGSVGFAYSPNPLSVQVGDTIRWEGDFSTHPLSSVTIPSGAQTWHMGSGTTFSYPVKVAGEYQYHCDAHFTFGMTGTFTASNAAIEKDNAVPVTGALRITGIFPNPSPSRNIAIIGFMLSTPQDVTLALYTLTGSKVRTLVKGVKEAGAYGYKIPAKTLESGIYLCRLSGRQSSAKILFVTK